MILLISAIQVARITGMNHWCTASNVTSFKKYNNSFNMFHFSTYINVYIIFPPYSPFCTLKRREDKGE
jgi:hypothetical protein